MKAKFLTSVKVILFVAWISEITKQLFADVLQSKCSLEVRNVHRKTAVLESLFNKVGTLEARNFIKKKLQHRCFSVKLSKFLKTLFLQNPPGGYFWKFLMNSLFVAYEEDEWRHIEVRIGYPAFIFFYCVCFFSFYFFLFFLFFCEFYYLLRYVCQHLKKGVKFSPGSSVEFRVVSCFSHI